MLSFLKEDQMMSEKLGQLYEQVLMLIKTQKQYEIKKECIAKEQINNQNTKRKKIRRENAISLSV